MAVSTHQAPDKGAASPPAQVAEQTAAQAMVQKPAPKPAPKPIFTDYASI